MKIALLAVCVLGLGCTAPLERRPPPATPVVVGRFESPAARPAPPSAECISLDRTHRTWGAIAKAAGVVSGTSGLATVPLDDSQRGLRLGIGLSAVVIAAVAVAAVYVEEDAASSWARDCGAP